MSQTVAEHISTLTNVIVFQGVTIAFLTATVVMLCLWPGKVAAALGWLPKKLAALENQ